MDLDVEPARADLERELLRLERSSASLAERALERTADVSDAAALFSALEALDVPAGAGVQVENRDGLVLAWAGTSVDDTALREIPLGGDGAVVVDTPASRRLAVRRTRTTPRGDVPARAVCHVPFEVRAPLRNRYFSSWSLSADVRARHRVDAAEVLPLGSDRGAPIRSAFGGDLARLHVTPLSARAWTEAVDRDAAARRAWLLVGAALAGGALAAWEMRRLGSRRPAVAALARAAVIAVLRAVVATVPVGSVLPASPATDPTAYAHGLPLAFAASPADLLLTCVAVLGIASCLRRAAQAARVRAATAWPGLAGVAAAVVLARIALDGFVEDTVRNSTVEFFSDVTVLPQAASAVLFGAVLAAAVAAVLLVAAAWTWLAPAREPSAARLAVLALAAGAAGVPFGPAGTASDAALAAAGIVGFATALGALLLDAGTAVRAALVPLGASLAVFAPLECRLQEAIRASVESQAAQRIRLTDATARLLVEHTLEEVAGSADLALALRDRRLPRDLQLQLWADSSLASRTGGSAIEIEPRDPEVPRARFSVNLPPANWLPPKPPPGEISAAPLPGRGAGRDGRWTIGSRPVTVDGVHAADVWVTLEVRPPSNPGLPELELLGPAGLGDTLEPPTVAVARYGPSGVLIETNDQYRSAGAALSPDLRARAVGSARPVWLSGTEADRAVVVVAEMDGAVASAFHAFSFDTGGTRRLSLRGARALLFGALFGALAVAATVRRWARGSRLRLAHRLVLSYVVVSGLPLLVLGWANRELARQRADDAALRELQEAVALLGAVIVDEPGSEGLPLRILELPDAERDEYLRKRAYEAGHHANAFHGAGLLASSDQGLFGTDLLPRRLPGPVYREILELKRPFERFPARVGDASFDVGYAPIRVESGEVIGAVSVPLLNQQRVRQADLADGVTAILAMYLASLLAAVGAGTWLAGRLTRPLRDLTTATQRVAAGDLSRPVPEAGPGELGDVVGAFNRMMRDLAESRERLVRAEKESAWRDMARQVAHEVKNPLTPMRLAAEHLRRAWKDRVPNFDEVLDRSVDLIVRQTESLKRIATSFSDFARLPGRRREPTDVAEIVRRVADLYKATPHLTARAAVEEGLPTVIADPDELQRVLVNLAKNAVESMDGRPGTLEMRLRRDGDALVLDVRDDGRGIPEDVLPRLFEPYFSTKTSGTGLGLAICKRAIEDLGGTIAVVSAADRGTTVTLRIPIAAQAPKA